MEIILIPKLHTDFLESECLFPLIRKTVEKCPVQNKVDIERKSCYPRLSVRFLGRAEHQRKSTQIVPQNNYTFRSRLIFHKCLPRRVPGQVVSTCSQGLQEFEKTGIKLPRFNLGILLPYLNDIFMSSSKMCSLLTRLQVGQCELRL